MVQLLRHTEKLLRTTESSMHSTNWIHWIVKNKTSNDGVYLSDQLPWLDNFQWEMKILWNGPNERK